MTQYGQQGPGISIPRDTPTSAPPATRPEPIGIERPSPLPPPQHQPEPAPAPVDHGAQRDGVDLSQYLSKADVEKTVRDLVTAWDNRAAKTLMRSDYQRGQRDNAYQSIEELRKAFKI